MNWLERGITFFCGSDDTGATPSSVASASSETLNSKSDDRSFGFHNAFGTAAEWQVQAESNSLFASNELTSISYGSGDSGIGSAGFDSFSSSIDFHHHGF